MNRWLLEPNERRRAFSSCNCPRSTPVWPHLQIVKTNWLDSISKLVSHGWDSWCWRGLQWNNGEFKVRSKWVPNEHPTHAIPGYLEYFTASSSYPSLHFHSSPLRTCLQIWRNEIKHLGFYGLPALKFSSQKTLPRLLLCNSHLRNLQVHALRIFTMEIKRRSKPWFDDRVQVEPDEKCMRIRLAIINSMWSNTVPASFISHPLSYYMRSGCIF